MYRIFDTTQMISIGFFCKLIIEMATCQVGKVGAQAGWPVIFMIMFLRNKTPNKNNKKKLVLGEKAFPELNKEMRLLERLTMSL